MTRRTRLHFTHRPGLSMIEVVISIGLLAIFASTLFVSIGSQLLLSVGTNQSLEALSLAREGLEAARSIRDTGWSSLVTGTHGLAYTNASYGFQGTSDTNGGFRRSVAVTDLTADERQVVSTVTWLGPTQRPITVSLATNLSNWRNMSIPLLSGNWNNPIVLSSFDLGPGNQATGVAVRNSAIYMTGSAASPGKPDFFTINAQDITSLTLASGLNTGPGLNGLAINGNFAYAANNDATQQLQIINISSTSSPYVIDNFRLTGNSAEAISVSVTGTLVLIGTENDAGPELYLVDVSNPTSPQIKSTLEIGGDVNRISLLNDRAYLATSSSTHEFMVVNISNPTTPVVSAYANLPGSTAAIGLYVNPQDDHAYITRKTDGGTSPEVNVYDVTTPEAPVSLGTIQSDVDIPAVFVADNLMFLGTTDSNLPLQLDDVTNPQGIVPWSPPGLRFPQHANDIAYQNNIVYFAMRSNDALRVITSQ